MLDSDHQSPTTDEQPQKLSPAVLRRISFRISENRGGNVKLPDRSQLTYDDKMDFCTIEAAAEYCRLDILSDISSNGQKYYDLIQPSDVAVYANLINSKEYQVYRVTHKILSFMPGLWGVRISESEMHHLLPICVFYGWDSDCQVDLIKSVSADGVFGSDNYDVGYTNSRYTIAAALTYIISRPKHTIRWVEKRFDTNRRIREIQHRCYCGAIRKILEVVDGVEVQKTHFSEQSDCAIVKKYLEVHPPKKLA